MVGTAVARHAHRRPARSPAAGSWVQAAPAGDEPLAPNYLSRSPQLRAAATDGTRSRARWAPTRLLQALVAHAALEELGRAADNVIFQRLGRDVELVAAAKTLRTDEIYGVLPVTAPWAPVRERADRAPRRHGLDARQLANLVIPDVTGTLTVAEHVADLVESLPERPEVHTLATFLERSRNSLPGPPRRSSGSFRDSSTQHPTATMPGPPRSRYGASRRCVTREPVASTSEGTGGSRTCNRTPRRTASAMYAPSLPHAATAAILRSGHLSHRDSEHETLDIQLSSDRVHRRCP